MRFELATAVLLRIQFFWDVTICCWFGIFFHGPLVLWRWRHCVHVKCWEIEMQWHSITFSEDLDPQVCEPSSCLNMWFCMYTGCPRRNVKYFGRVFLTLNYTDITQNTYIQSRTVTEIMAREVWNFDSCYTLIYYQIHIETGRNMWFL